jgi:hypothetical protein
LYVAGHHYLSNGYFTGCYWKNGTVNDLTSASNSDAKSIYVSDTDVYLCGYQIINGDYIGYYWKNNTATELNELDSSVKSIVVSNTDIYISGGLPSAYNWINGNKFTIRGDQYYDTSAYSLFVKKP